MEISRQELVFGERNTKQGAEKSENICGKQFSGAVGALAARIGRRVNERYKSVNNRLRLTRTVLRKRLKYIYNETIVTGSAYSKQEANEFPHNDGLGAQRE